MIEIPPAVDTGKMTCAGEEARSVAARIAATSSRSEENIAGTFDALMRRLERTAWPDLLWRFSSLCEDACPVEFTFSTEDDVVRYTTEVAGPELSEHLRLDRTCACLEELALDLPPRGMVDEWHEMQANARLRWGTWLGIRHKGGSREAKLYIEVPRERCRWGPKPLTPCSRLHMIGFDPSTLMTEHYFRVGEPDDIEHRALLSSFLQHTHWPLLLESFSALRQMPGEAALRWTRFGYSLSRLPCATGPGRLTLFVDSGVCGGASGVRQRLLDAMGIERYRKSAYGTMLAHSADDQLPAHGVVGIAMGTSGKVELRVGVSAMALAATLDMLAMKDGQSAGKITQLQRPVSAPISKTR